MGSCVCQCYVPRQVGPVSAHCDGVGCHVLCLWHGISVWQHIGQSTTATSGYCRDMTLDVKVTLNPNKLIRDSAYLVAIRAPVWPEYLPTRLGC